MNFESFNFYKHFDEVFTVYLTSQLTYYYFNIITNSNNKVRSLILCWFLGVAPLGTNKVSFEFECHLRHCNWKVPQRKVGHIQQMFSFVRTRNGLVFNLWCWRCAAPSQVRGWAAGRCTARRASSTTPRTTCCCRTSAPSACAAGTRARPRGRTCCRWATTTSCAASCTRPPTRASWPAATTSGPASGTAAPPRTNTHTHTHGSDWLCRRFYVMVVARHKREDRKLVLPALLTSAGLCSLTRALFTSDVGANVHDNFFFHQKLICCWHAKKTYLN